jgi:hypothetical protein
MSIRLPNTRQRKRVNVLFAVLRNSRGLSFILLALVCGLMAGVLAAVPARGDDTISLQAKLNGGYFLFHHLASDESQVPLLMIVKHVSPGIKEFADDIGKEAKKSLVVLDRFQADDAAIRFDRDPLPQIELDTRASIKADKQHQLLFGTSDSEFARAFLVSQIEASSYGIHLSKVLGEQETSPARAEKLRRLSAEWMALRDHAFQLLRDY